MDHQKTLMFIGAHPDDETFGLGGVLALYSSKGVKVYYVCATKGEAGTVDTEYLKKHGTIAGVRTYEMDCAARALGLTGVIYLGYRDSGMPGSADNSHPDALMAAPLEQVSEKIVKVMRELKPDVVVTHDAGGGYGHPDHIAVHNAAVNAFYAAGSASKYPSAGLPFQPARLYFSIRPRGAMKLVVRLMPFFGQNPKGFGRNKDIDLTRMMGQEYPVNAVIRLNRQAVEMRNLASACHASQGGGRPGPGTLRLLRFIESLQGPKHFFMRAYPPPESKREKDLFAGLNP